MCDGPFLLFLQLQVAQSYIDYHTKKFGYESPNVRFLKGYIEELRQCGITDDSTDIIVYVIIMNGINEEIIIRISNLLYSGPP